MKTRLHMNQKKPCPSLPVYGGDGENDISVICKNCWHKDRIPDYSFAQQTRSKRSCTALIGDAWYQILVITYYIVLC